MIEEKIPGRWKISLVRSGPSDVFGSDTSQRLAFAPAGALARFADAWWNLIEPEMRAAPEISAWEARSGLEGKQRDFAPDSHQYRRFCVGSAHFIARLNFEAKEEGYCDQLWSLRIDNGLRVDFDSQADKQKFGKVAARLAYQPGRLAAELLTDFIKKFSMYPAA